MQLGESFASYPKWHNGESTKTSVVIGHVVAFGPGRNIDAGATPGVSSDVFTEVTVAVNQTLAGPVLDGEVSTYALGGSVNGKKYTTRD